MLVKLILCIYRETITSQHLPMPMQYLMLLLLFLPITVALAMYPTTISIILQVQYSTAPLLLHLTIHHLRYLTLTSLLVCTIILLIYSRLQPTLQLIVMNQMKTTQMRDHLWLYQTAFLPAMSHSDRYI